MLRLLLVGLFILPGFLIGQVQLGPCLESGQLPLATDSIQPVVPYIDTTSTYMSGGFQVGDIVNDFILFDTGSTPYQLSQLLNSGKPVFLTSGSYSCPAYRYCMNQVIPDLVAMFGSQVIFLNIYQVEAHPVTPDLSPYSGTVYTTAQNYTDNVLLLQERVYGQRRSIAMNSMSTMGAPCPILLDGPGNEYWSTFGPSPNNGYLITRDGWVFSKYGWMSQSKQQAILDINMLLNTTGIAQANSDWSLIAPMANPGTSLSVLTSCSSAPLQLRISDVTGKVITQSVLQPHASFALGEALPANGLYFVEIIAEDRYLSFSFVKAQ